MLSRCVWGGSKLVICYGATRRDAGDEHTWTYSLRPGKELVYNLHSPGLF